MSMAEVGAVFDEAIDDAVAVVVVVDAVNDIWEARV